MKELQAMLDALIKGCGDTYAIEDGKIVQLKEAELKTIMRVSTSYYERYVGEKGALYQNETGDRVIPKDLADLIADKKPKRIEAITDGCNLIRVEFDGVDVGVDVSYETGCASIFCLEWEEEAEKFVFLKEGEGYSIDIEESDFEITDDEGSYAYLSMKIIEVERLQPFTSSEDWD